MELCEERDALAAMKANVAALKEEMEGLLKKKVNLGQLKNVILVVKCA